MHYEHNTHKREPSLLRVYCFTGDNKYFSFVLFELRMPVQSECGLEVILYIQLSVRNPTLAALAVKTESRTVTNPDATV